MPVKMLVTIEVATSGALDHQTMIRDRIQEVLAEEVVVVVTNDSDETCHSVISVMSLRGEGTTIGPIDPHLLVGTASVTVARIDSMEGDVTDLVHPTTDLITEARVLDEGVSRTPILCP